MRSPRDDDFVLRTTLSYGLVLTESWRDGLVGKCRIRSDRDEIHPSSTLLKFNIGDVSRERMG